MYEEAHVPIHQEAYERLKEVFELAIKARKIDHVHLDRVVLLADGVRFDYSIDPPDASYDCSSFALFYKDICQAVEDPLSFQNTQRIAHLERQRQQAEFEKREEERAKEERRKQWEELNKEFGKEKGADD